ncbi:hypothetical protein [Novosphingobium colocasiae]|uniref:hypothetical protein n=1 Tax=Novosphingobium colocasiae TaxID=1256513 RepID=UPI0035B4DE96
MSTSITLQRSNTGSVPAKGRPDGEDAWAGGCGIEMIGRHVHSKLNLQSQSGENRPLNLLVRTALGASGTPAKDQSVYGIDQSERTLP